MNVMQWRFSSVTLLLRFNQAVIVSNRINVFDALFVILHTH